MCDSGVILLGEFRSSSLLGFKGLKHVVRYHTWFPHCLDGEKKKFIHSLIKRTDKEKSHTFLIRSGCDTAPMHLINRTFSSCRSASFKSCITDSRVLPSPCLRTVLYTADLKSAGMVDSPLQCASNLFCASATVAGWPYLPKRPIIKPLRRASRWPEIE